MSSLRGKLNGRHNCCSQGYLLVKVFSFQRNTFLLFYCFFSLLLFFLIFKLCRLLQKTFLSLWCFFLTQENSSRPEKTSRLFRHLILNIFLLTSNLLRHVERKLCTFISSIHKYKDLGARSFCYDFIRA